MKFGDLKDDYTPDAYIVRASATTWFGFYSDEEEAREAAARIKRDRSNDYRKCRLRVRGVLLSGAGTKGFIEQR